MLDFDEKYANYKIHEHEDIYNISETLLKRHLVEDNYRKLPDSSFPLLDGQIWRIGNTFFINKFNILPH